MEATYVDDEFMMNIDNVTSDSNSSTEHKHKVITVFSREVESNEKLGCSMSIIRCTSK